MWIEDWEKELHQKYFSVSKEMFTNEYKDTVFDLLDQIMILFM